MRSSVPFPPSLSAGGMSPRTTSRPSLLPPPVTASDSSAHSNGRIGVGRTAAPSLIALAAGLVAVSSHQSRAELLFVGAGTVALGLYFIVPPKDDEKTYPILSTFLRHVPEVFTACGCILVVLGIGNAFPREIALIPLFSFVSFAALATLFSTVLDVWTAAMLYAAALVSLVSFVVLAFMA